MRQFRIILIFNLIFLVFNSVYSQDMVKIDSLRQVIVSAKHDTIKIQALLKIGKLYEDIIPDTSLSNYNKALKLSQKNKNQEYIAVCFNHLGIVYNNKSNNDKAIEYYTKALNINKQLGDKLGIARNYLNIGVIYLRQDNYNKALESYFKSLKIVEELGNKYGIAINFGNIGIVYFKQNNNDKALEYYLKALNICEEIDDKYGIARHLVNIGNVNLAKNNTDEALEYFLKAAKINEELENKYGIASSFGRIASAYSQQEKYDEAIKYYLKAIKINDEIKDKNSIAANFINIGGIYSNIKQYNKAISYINKGIDVSKEIGALLWERNAYSALSKTYERMNDYKNSLKYQTKWIELNDSIFNTEKAKSLAEMQSKFDYEKKVAIDSIATAKQMEIKDAEIAKVTAEKKVQQTQRNLFIIGFGLMLVLAGFVFRSYRQKKKANILLAEQKHQIAEANEELNQQNEEITAQRDEIESQRDIVINQKEKIEEIYYEISESINYATRLQGAILPESQILEKYISDHFVLFKPKDKVSGDFYWWANVENHTIITAADSTGHGVPGAFMSMLGASFLREIVQKEYVTHTGVILRKLRKEIIKALKQKGEMGEQKDGMDMAIISIDHETNIVQYSGANNPLYIVTSKHQGFKTLDALDSFKSLMDYGALSLYEVKPNKMPIAIFDKMNTFTTHEIQLEKGDQLYMFSDGYADQFGGPKNKKFKYKPFKKLLLENADKPMSEQKEILNQAFEGWKGNTEQIDDVVVVGVKI